MTEIIGNHCPARHDRSTTAAASGITTRLAPYGLAGVRLVFSFLFVCHGVQGMFGAFGGIDGHGMSVPFGVWPGWWATAIEAIAGALVFFGLGTRPAALLCSGAMAYAYFTVHVPMGLLPLQNQGEPAVLFCWAFLLIAILGPGAFAVDRLLRRHRDTAATTR